MPRSRQTGASGTQCAHVLLEAIEALLPETPIVLQPVGRVLEWTGLELARAPLRLTSTRDQAGAFQNLEMLGDGGKAHREGLSQLRYRGLARGEAGQNRAPGGVGERREDDA